jgi:RNA polymerase sigma-70 factor (ECF subfamily)
LDSGFAGRTSISMLAKLRQDPTDQAAWSEFVRRYGPWIYRWCRQWHLPEADAQDVTQNVLLVLAKQMRTFTYDPALSFRAWLKTVTHHTWNRYVANRSRPGRGTGDSAVLELLRNVAAGDDLAKQIQEGFDREFLQEAMTRVQARVAPNTWDAFRLTALEGLSGAEAAAQLNIKVATVFVYRGRVQRMLQEELARLEEDEPQ